MLVLELSRVVIGRDVVCNELLSPRVKLHNLFEHLGLPRPDQTFIAQINLYNLFVLILSLCPILVAIRSTSIEPPSPY